MSANMNLNAIKISCKSSAFKDKRLQLWWMQTWIWMRLRYHVKALHLKIKNYNCDECEYAKGLRAKHFTSNKIIKSSKREILDLVIFHNFKFVKVSWTWLNFKLQENDKVLRHWKKSILAPWNLDLAEIQNCNFVRVQENLAFVKFHFQEIDKVLRHWKMSILAP